MANELTGIMSDSGIGARVKRKEDERHLHGRGRFVSDILLPNLHEVAFLRSPLAHGRIRGIEVPDDLKSRVYTAADLDGVAPIRAVATVPGFKASDYPPLATGKVRYAGEAMAMCVAKTRAEAEDMVDLIRPDLEELPAVCDVDAAVQAGSALVHEDWGDNLFLDTVVGGDLGDLEQTAPVIVEREYKMARQVMNPMEGKAVLAHWDDTASQLIVYTSTQVPHSIRSGLSMCLGLPEEKIRVIAPDVGGGFGYKCVLQPEEICVAWLAMKRRHPVRWVEDRREHLTAGANTREHYYKVKAYADERGKLLGLDATVTISVGAYSVWPFTAVIEAGQAGGNLPGPYVFDKYRCRTVSVATNKPPFTPYRGVARPGVCFAMDLTIDAVAREVGREPHEVRAENLVQPEQMPFMNITNKYYDSGDFPAGVHEAVEKIDVAGVRDSRAVLIARCRALERVQKLLASAGPQPQPGHDVRVTDARGLLTGRTDEHVGELVTVDVAGGGDGVAVPVSRCRAGDPAHGLARASGQDLDIAGLLGIGIRSDADVGVAVAVDVSGSTDRETELVADRGALRLVDEVLTLLCEGRCRAQQQRERHGVGVHGNLRDPREEERVQDRASARVRGARLCQGRVVGALDALCAAL